MNSILNQLAAIIFNILKKSTKIYKFRNNNTDQNNMEIERSGYGTMWKIEENREIQRKINIMVYQGDWENDGNNIFK